MQERSEEEKAYTHADIDTIANVRLIHTGIQLDVDLQVPYCR